MDKKDDKWTEIRPSKGSSRKNAAEECSYVLEGKRETGTPDKIRTCDLLLRRQAAITCYLGLRPGKWTLNGQKRSLSAAEQGVNLPYEPLRTAAPTGSARDLEPLGRRSSESSGIRAQGGRHSPHGPTGVRERVMWARAGGRGAMAGPRGDDAN